MNCVWDITNSVVEGSMSIYLPTGRRELRHYAKQALTESKKTQDAKVIGITNLRMDFRLKL